MCEFASFVLTKDREYWHPTSHSHENIISHHKIEHLDSTVTGLVRVEITPNNEDIKNLDSWVFRVDQDIFPAWTFHRDPVLERRTREALARRAEAELWFAEICDASEARVGYHGTATAGYRGTASAGDRGTATAGYRGTATAGYRGTATAGDDGTATAGDDGTATAGDDGTATAGDDGTASAGDRGTATAGYRGTATAGDRGTATAGDDGTATAGDRGTATAGYRGTATAGDDAIIAVKYWDGSRYRLAVGYTGEDGIERGKAYRVNAGRLVEA
jgi:hypothetical protein